MTYLRHDDVNLIEVCPQLVCHHLHQNSNDKIINNPTMIVQSPIMIG